MQKDPVNDNQSLPPGATPKDVADNVPIMASEGEYLIPANVVRFIGLDKIEKMVDKAKEQLAELEKNGRIGGELPEEELPFDPSELQVIPQETEQLPHMAEGGPIPGLNTPQGEKNFTGIKPFTDENGQTIYIPYFNGQPLYSPPTGYEESQPNVPESKEETPPTEIDKVTGQPLDNSAKENTAFVKANESPLAGNPNEWTVDDFIDFGKQREDFGTKAIKGIISFMPGGKLAMKARDRYLNRETSELMDQMIETGVDLQGNPITPEQITMLSQTRQNLINDMQNQSKLNLSGFGKLKDAWEVFQGFTTGDSGQGSPLSSVKPEAEKMMQSFSQPGQTYSSPPDNDYQTGVGTGMGLNTDRQGGNPSQQEQHNAQTGSGGWYSKGGLIRRRA